MEREFRYPKDPVKNMEWRHKMLRKASRDVYFQKVLKELFAKDILFAFNAFFYTLDVRKRPFQHQPFCTWVFQDEAILGYQESITIGRDEVWEKSRDMGASWVALGCIFHTWMHPQGGGDSLLGSRIEDYVDKKGDMRALFPKLRYLLYRLPKWMRPRGFSVRKHDTYMKLENPETGSTVIGESNNANFSTGGRFVTILFDEFAKWESTDEQAWTAAGDATPSRLAISTPFGAGGQYYTLVTDGKTLKRTFHWTQHPEKSRSLSCVWPPPNEETKDRLGEHWRPEEKLVSPWYLKQVERRRKREVSQEIDIDYLGSGNPIFDGASFESLQLYLKLPDAPKAFGQPNLAEFSAEFSNSPPEDNEGYILIYEYYKKGYYYSLGVDVVEGIEGGDYAVITVLNRLTKSVVCIYWSQIDEIGLARVVKIITDLYSESPGHYESPWVGIETNGPGLATFDFAAEFGVANLFMAPRYDVTAGGVSHKKGWKTDTNSRNELISGIREWLADRAGEIHCHRLIGECMTFIRSKTGKAQAKAGCHDDHVMSFGIAIQVDQIAPLPERLEKRASYPEAEDYQTPFNLEDLRIDEPITLEERCLADALARKFENTHREDMTELWGEVRHYG